MRNCFVPGCDQQHKHAPKRAMFLAPKKKELLQKWIEALPKIRSFKAHDKVCHLHFREEDIISTYDHTINGQIYRLDRGRPRIKPEAVPVSNLPTVEELKTISRRNVKTSIVEKSASLPQDDAHVEIEPEDYVDIFVVREDSESKRYSEVRNTTTYEVVNDDEPNELYSPELDIVYNTFFDNIHEVALPNTLWGVHRCPERSVILFTYMNIDELRCTKVVRVSTDGLLKVFVNNRQAYELSIMDGIHTFALLSEILRQIDEMDVSDANIQKDEYQLLEAEVQLANVETKY